MPVRAWKLTLTSPGEPARSRVVSHHELLEVLESVAEDGIPVTSEVTATAL